MNLLPAALCDYITTRFDNTLPTRLEGWCTHEKAEALATAVLSRNCLTALEIGVFAGRSLFAIAIAQAALSPNARCLGIDPWSAHASVSGFESDPANRDWWSRLDHSAIYQQCVDTVAALGLTNVSLFRGTAAQAAVALRFAQPSPWLHLLHIDGNHSEASALHDVEQFVPMVVPGGTVVFDDCDWETTKQAQRRLSELCDLGRMVGACGFYTRKATVVSPSTPPLQPPTPLPHA